MLRLPGSARFHQMSLDVVPYQFSSEATLLSNLSDCHGILAWDRCRGIYALGSMPWDLCNVHPGPLVFHLEFRNLSDLTAQATREECVITCNQWLLYKSCAEIEPGKRELGANTRTSRTLLPGAHIGQSKQYIVRSVVSLPFNETKTNK